MDFQQTKRRIQSSLRLRSMRYLGRSQIVRALFRGLPRSADNVSSPLFPSADLTKTVRSLRSEGIAFGLDLPPAVVTDIRDWAKREPRYAERDIKLGFREEDRARAEAALARPITLASFVRTADCPAIERVRQDPLLAAVAQQYLGPRSRLISSTLWWSYPAEALPEATKSANAQLFHYDLDDFGFLKFFFYLTDVDDEAGPHVYVKGTHRRKSLPHLLHMRRYSDQDIEDTYGSDRTLSVVGPSGTGFAGDTFGFHKGMPPKSKPRLLLQLLFAHYFYGWEDDVPRRSRPTMIELSKPNA